MKTSQTKSDVFVYLDGIYQDKTTSYPKLTVILETIKDMAECSGIEATALYNQWVRKQSDKQKLLKAIN